MIAKMGFVSLPFLVFFSILQCFECIVYLSFQSYYIEIKEVKRDELTITEIEEVALLCEEDLMRLY